MLCATLRNLRRRLDRWELQHLREHAAELADELERTRNDLADAEARAELWQRDVFQMHEALASEDGASHRAVGLTRDGALMVVKL